MVATFDGVVGILLLVDVLADHPSNAVGVLISVLVDSSSNANVGEVVGVLIGRSSNLET